MNKSTFGFLATIALVCTPVAAFGQDNQQNLQLNRSAGAAVGAGNFVNQQTAQDNWQNQTSFDDYYGEPSTQMSIQDNAHTGSAVGEYNLVNQGAVQTNGQSNTDINSYPDYYPAHY